MRSGSEARPLALLVVALSLPAAEGASAQTLAGRLLDASTDRPVALARVRLLARDSTPVALTVSDPDGWFAVTAPGAGGYLVTALSAFYLPRIDGPLQLGAGDTLRVELRIEPRPVPLDPVIARARKQRKFLADAGFYKRKGAGFGSFVTREDFERRDPQFLSDVVTDLPRARITIGPDGRRDIIFGAFGARGFCHPRVYMDGIIVAMGGSDRAEIDDLVSPKEVEAMEVYRSPAEVPIRYGGPASACGVIVIWLQRD